MAIDTKYIFVTNGNVSSPDMANTAASIARLLLLQGYSVNVLKFDTSLNIDYSTMPHGECFVTASGDEVSPLMGIYEQHTGIKTTRANNITMGRIYQTVIDNERRGEYGDETVMLIPHITNEIKRNILALGINHDFVVTHIDGAVGDLETAPLLEAVSQLQNELGSRCVCATLGVTTMHDEVARLIHEATDTPIESDLNELVESPTSNPCINIAMVGNHSCELIANSLKMATGINQCDLSLKTISDCDVNDGNAEKLLDEIAGVVVASGQGQRGIEGKIAVLKWCREHDIPTLAIGQGMQCMVVEYARNVLGLTGANSTEADPGTEHNIVDTMERTKRDAFMCGTMRLGEYTCWHKAGTKVATAYGVAATSERHRHRYELNNQYRAVLEEAGMMCVGQNPETQLVEIVEVPQNRWYVGTQFHPEFNSTTASPHSLLMDFARHVAAYTNDKEKNKSIDINPVNCFL